MNVRRILLLLEEFERCSEKGREGDNSSIQKANKGRLFLIASFTDVVR
jgi:hypothetical protein